MDPQCRKNNYFFNNKKSLKQRDYQYVLDRTERKDSLYLMNRVLEIRKSLYFVSNERFINS